MINISKMSRAELGAFVQEHLRKYDIDVVLSGGSCVSVYSHDKYVSMDLDMIHTSYMSPKRRVLEEAMLKLGFDIHGRYFVHPDTDLYIELPKGPPAVGEEPVKEICEIKTSTGVLRLISPTDCVKDRLTWYYHDNDLECLEQAILVAENNDIDIAEVQRWSENEGKGVEFEKIRLRLEKQEL